MAKKKSSKKKPGLYEHNINMLLNPLGTLMGLGAFGSPKRIRESMEDFPNMLGQLKSGEDEPLWMNLLKGGTKDIRTLPASFMLPAHEISGQLGSLSRGEQPNNPMEGSDIWARLLAAATGNLSTVGGAMAEGAFGVGGGLVPQYNWSPEALDEVVKYTALDEREREAFRDDPSRQTAKAMSQVGGKFLGAALPGMGDAAAAGKGFMGRVATKGASRLPGNVMQAFGAAEPYKGQSEAGSMAGAGIMSFLQPLAGETLKSLGDAGGRLEKGGKRVERSGRHVPTDRTPEGLTTTEIKQDQVESVVSKHTGKKHVIGGQLKSSNIDEAGNKVSTQLVEEMRKVDQTLGKDELVNRVSSTLQKDLGWSKQEALEAATKQVNEVLYASKVLSNPDFVTDGKINAQGVGILKKFTQHNAMKLRETGGMAGDALLLDDVIHNDADQWLQINLGDKGNELYKDYSTLWTWARDIMAGQDADLAATQYTHGWRVPGAAAVGQEAMSLLGRGIRGAGAGLQKMGEMGGMLDQIPPEMKAYLSSEAGRLLGGQMLPPERSPQQGMQEIDLGTLPGWGGMDGTDMGGMGAEGVDGMGMQPPMGQGMDPGMGGMGMGGMGQGGGYMPPLPPVPEQPQGPQFDMDRLAMDLVQGVLAGQISGADAQNILGMMQAQFGQQEQQYPSDYEPDNLLDAMDYLGQRYPDMPDGTRASLAKSLVEDKTKGLNEQAVSGLRTLDRIEELAEGVDFAGTGIGAIAKSPFLSLGAASGEDEGARLYRDMKESFLATLARAKGERGMLTDQDLARVEKALPNFTDSESMAKKKMNESRKILYEILGISDEEAKELLGTGGLSDTSFSGDRTDDYDLSWIE